MHEPEFDDVRLSPHEGAVFFHDDAGVKWQVFEMLCADGTPCLVFESHIAFRRVRSYPANWRDLYAAQLVEISWRR